MFDCGSTFFSMLTYSTLGLDMICKILIMFIHIATLVGDPLMVDQTYWFYVVTHLENDTG